MKFLFAISIFLVVIIVPACQEPIDQQIVSSSSREIAPAVAPDAIVNAVVEYKGMSFDLGITQIILSDGTSLTERILEIILLSKNHGDFKKRLSNFLDELVKNGVITKAQRDAVIKALNERQIP